MTFVTLARSGVYVVSFVLLSYSSTRRFVFLLLSNEVDLTMWFMAALLHLQQRRGRNYENNEIRPSIRVQIANAANGQSDDGDTNTSTDGRTLPLLYTLARGWAWEAVAFRCQSHPEEADASLTDYHGDNVLHWSAFGRPPLAPIDALLRVSPGLARTRNKKGLFPLHGTSMSMRVL
jgi:hypothetical protein